METVWFAILVFMLTVYVVLDGFDFGAGILHLFVAKNEEQGQSILRSIGPFWDGNEVWLVAGGGVLFIAFPLFYASAFSGFYLALMLVLWLLIGRAVSLELRHIIDNPLWKSFFGTLFGISSLLLALFFGTALGNVVRGVTFVSEMGGRYFFTPLFTDFLPSGSVGVLDWFTVLMGLIAVLTLTIHGANWVILKNPDEQLNDRLRAVSLKTWWALLVLVVFSLPAVYWVRAGLFDNFIANPFMLILPAAGFASLIATRVFIARKQESAAFGASSGFIVFTLVSTALGLYPALLPSVKSGMPGLDIYNSSNTQYGLWVALIWWCIALVLAIAYFTYVHRVFKGKISGESEIYGGH